MWTRILILAVLWLALFRFVGRLIRFLAGPAGVAGRPAATREHAPNRATGAGAARRDGVSGGGVSGDGVSMGGTSRSGASRDGTPRSVPGEVIDVEFEDLTPGSRR